MWGSFTEIYRGHIASKYGAHRRFYNDHTESKTKAVYSERQRQNQKLGMVNGKWQMAKVSVKIESISEDTANIKHR
jgi:hypothetical protein